MNSNFAQLIAASPDPQTTTNRLERIVEDGETSSIIHSLDADQLQGLISIIGISGFLFNLLCRYPRMIPSIGHKAADDHSAIHGIHDLDRLRLYKYQELLKITWMDLSRRFDYVEVLDALSNLAIVIVRQALKMCLDDESYQTINRSMAVLALGKLGAHELNYSSDIDLIFVYDNKGVQADEKESIQKLCMDTIRRLSRALEEKTADGFLYRVDLKLRPWGKSGPLIMSVDDTEHYYEASSEPWERFAWLRARVIAGAEDVGNELLRRMRPFVFRQSLSADDLRRFIKIKHDMEKARKREGHWDVKVGAGGIRDIEFFIQVIQIVNAAKHEALHTTNTIQALAGLQGTGLIGKDEAGEISASYLFLRRLENRLQMVDEQQTQSLPDKVSQRLLLARSLGFSGAGDETLLNNFNDTLAANQRIAKSYFDRILPDESGMVNEEEEALKKTWNRSAAESSLERWQEVCGKEGWGSVPKRLDALAMVFGASWYFTRVIFYRGFEIAALIDQGTVYDIDRPWIDRKLAPILEMDSLERQLDRLRLLKNEIMLQILVYYLMGGFDQRRMEKALTDLADVTLSVLLRLHALQSDPSIHRLAILGMGRMAGDEMNFGSDLDLIFLFKTDSVDHVTDIQGKIRLLLRSLSFQSPAGSLYDIDMRLRPHGTSGSLLTSVESFLEYHRGERDIWERQMMTRCLPVFDDSGIGREVLDSVKKHLYGQYDNDYLRSEISAMRERVEREKGNPRGKYEVKRGKGGIMDIDFLTHYFQLRHGHEHESLRTGSTRIALEQIQHLGLMEADHVDVLLAAYDFLKRIETRLRLFDMKAISAFPQEPAAHIPLARAMGYFDDDEDQFAENYLSVTDKVRGLFNHYLTRE